MATDRELLELCMEAFDAIELVTTSRAVLKKIDPNNTQMGNGRDLLAREMVARIRRHLQTDQAGG